MQCPNCGKTIEQDDVFCPFCGIDIRKELERKRQEEAARKAREAAKEVAHNSKNSSSSNPVQQTNVNKGLNIPASEKTVVYLDRGYKPATFILLILIVALGILFGYEYMKLDSTILENNKIIAEKDKRISKLNSELNNALKDPALDMYDGLVKLLANDNLGYATKNFKSDKGIYLVKNGQEGELVLTCYLEKNGQIGCHIVESYTKTKQTNPIELSYADKWVGNENHMKIKATRPGAALVKFSNTVNDNIFFVVIIVTE